MLARRSLEPGSLIVLYDPTPSPSMVTPTSHSPNLSRCATSRTVGRCCSRQWRHRHHQFQNAVATAKAEREKPTIIITTTTIGSKNAGSEKTHGAPLGDEDIANIKKQFGFNPDEKFQVPPRSRTSTASVRRRRRDCRRREGYLRQLQPSTQRNTPRSSVVSVGAWSTRLRVCPSTSQRTLPRPPSLSGAAINRWWARSRRCSEVLRISPVLTHPGKVRSRISSTTRRTERTSASAFVSTAWPLSPTASRPTVVSVRTSQPSSTLLLRGRCTASLVTLEFLVIYVGTHDSIELGEDGSTHQPVEVLTWLRAQPNMLVMRPCDGNEASACWRIAGGEEEANAGSVARRCPEPRPLQSGKRAQGRVRHRWRRCQAGHLHRRLRNRNQKSCAAAELNQKPGNCLGRVIVCWELFEDADGRTAVDHLAIIRCQMLRGGWQHACLRQARLYVKIGLDTSESLLQQRHSESIWGSASTTSWKRLPAVL